MIPSTPCPTTTLCHYMGRRCWRRL